VRTPSEPGLLRVWERGAGTASAAPAEGRAGALLAAAAALPPTGLGGLTPGQRDARLLELRRRLFGDALDGVARCPACEGTLEFSLPVAALADAGSAAVEVDGAAAEVEIEGYRIRVRPPTLAEVAAIGPDDGVDRLLRGCVARAERDGAEVPAAALPASALEAVDTRLAVLDPAGDPELALRCPDCGHAWAEPLDVAAFLWSELDAWARRVLQEVHVLARAYGWTEREVLRLGPRRRRYYLDLVLG
jgi:hypothetical protein